MKRILSLTTMLLFTIASFAYDAKINGIYYNTGEKIGEASVTYGDEYYSGDVVIPSSFYNGKPWTVTSIGGAAFKLCWNLASVTVPRSVTSIGACAFLQSGLTSITIPNSVTSIGWEAFGSCKRLASVTIPNSVTCIEQDAFRDCTSLSSVTIPNSVRDIGYMAFYGCTSLTSITIHGSTLIGPNAFQGCDALKDVYNESMIPQGISNEETFSSYSIATLHVPVGTKALYQTANHWKNFSNIVDDITILIVYIDGIYYEISVDEAIVVKGDEPYSGNVVIPKSIVYDNRKYDVTIINDGAFKNSPNLISVTIPESVTVIGEDAFSNCPNLVTIYDEATNPQVLTNGPGFNETTTLHVPEGSKDKYENASYWKDINNIVDDITKIKVYINGICYELSGDEATVISADEPYSDNVVIPNTVVYENKTYDVTKIDDGAFKDSPNLVSVTIPESVTVIGEDAFSNCPNLVTIYNEAINPQVLTGDPGFDESTTVHVPEGSKDSYKNADYWKDFSNIVDDIPTAINNVSGNVYLKVKSNFSIDGKSISQPQKGMNIQKMSDGTTIKVLKD